MTGTDRAENRTTRSSFDRPLPKPDERGAGGDGTYRQFPYVELMGRDPGDIGDESVVDAVPDLNLEFVDRQVHEMRDIEATTMASAWTVRGHRLRSPDGLSHRQALPCLPATA
jgi:hypothetical protein